MTEIKKKYKVDQPVAVARNYSLTMMHIAKVSDMADRLKISQGEVVRRAIDMLWADLEKQDSADEE